MSGDFNGRNQRKDLIITALGWEHDTISNTHAADLRTKATNLIAFLIPIPPLLDLSPLSSGHLTLLSNDHIDQPSAHYLRGDMSHSYAHLSAFQITMV